MKFRVFKVIYNTDQRERHQHITRTVLAPADDRYSENLAAVREVIDRELELAYMVPEPPIELDLLDEDREPIRVVAQRRWPNR